MLKKVVSFIVFSYGFISSNDSAEIYNAESEVGYDLNVQFPEFRCPINYTTEYCMETMNFASGLISDYMYELQSLIVEVLILKEYNDTLQIVGNSNMNLTQSDINACNSGQIYAKRNISTKMATAFNIIDWVRNNLNYCENYLDATKKEYFTKINIVDDKNKPDIDAMKSGVEKICDDISKSCMQVDKIYYKTNVEIVLDKLIRFATGKFKEYMYSWNSTYYVSSDSNTIACESVKREIKGLYYYIDYLRSIINGCETLLTSLNKEMVDYDIDESSVPEPKFTSTEFVRACDEKKKNWHDNLKCECCFNETDEDYSDDEWGESEDLKDTQTSPTEEVKNLIRKHSKGKNKENPLFKKSRSKKHYGYAGKKFEHCTTHNNDRKSSCDAFFANKPNAYEYEYNPEDMFTTSDDIYSTFIQR